MTVLPQTANLTRPLPCEIARFLFHGTPIRLGKPADKSETLHLIHGNSRNVGKYPLLICLFTLLQVEPISQKRTLAFMNHFVIHTAHFLSRFSCVCEEKLSDLSIRLQRLETTLKLLEGKVCILTCLQIAWLLGHCCP